MYKVYVKTDEQGRVVAINSDAFLSDLEGWTLIDEGNGDKFRHAQGNYLSTALHNDLGVLCYKLIDGMIKERTEDEKKADEEQHEIVPTTEERLTALEKAGLERDSALMELANMLMALMGGM